MNKLLLSSIAVVLFLVFVIWNIDNHATQLRTRLAEFQQDLVIADSLVAQLKADIALLEKQNVLLDHPGIHRADTPQRAVAKPPVCSCPAAKPSICAQASSVVATTGLVREGSGQGVDEARLRQLAVEADEADEADKVVADCRK